MAEKTRHEMTLNGKDKPVLDPILDNPQADALISRRAVAGAIADGMDEDLARRLYS